MNIYKFECLLDYFIIFFIFRFILFITVLEKKGLYDFTRNTKKINLYEKVLIITSENWNIQNVILKIISQKILFQYIVGN